MEAYRIQNSLMKTRVQVIFTLTIRAEEPLAKLRIGMLAHKDLSTQD